MRLRTGSVGLLAVIVGVAAVGLSSRATTAAETSTGFPEPGAALFEDNGAVTDARSVWGLATCEDTTRYGLLAPGGDPSPTAAGSGQGNDSYRRMTVFDGDDVWGERCELGQNDFRHAPTALYHEGDRRLTFASFRLSDGYPLQRKTWQIVMQMKQTWPAANSGGYPALALHAFDGRWILYRGGRVKPVWSAPARAGVWTRFAFDIAYSRSARRGSVRVYADLDGDGDAHGADEQSPAVSIRTLKRARKGNGKGNRPAAVHRGDSIPSHLRVGVYHDPALSCPRPTGCSVDVDNVGVYETG